MEGLRGYCDDLELEEMGKVQFHIQETPRQTASFIITAVLPGRKISSFPYAAI